MITMPDSSSELGQLGETPSIGRKTKLVVSEKTVRKNKRYQLVLLAGVTIGIALLLGFLWHALIKLPYYTITDDRSALIREYGLTQFFATDAWFSIVGVVAGFGIGSISWHLYRHLGWPVVAVAVGASLLAGLVCWQFGVLLGPSDFAIRVATALPGEHVMIDFNLNTWVSLLTWPLGGVVAVLLGSLVIRYRVKRVAASANSLD